MNILVADDDPINLLLVKGVIEPLGHDIVTASGGEEARDLLARQDFDLLLLDLMMPDVDGLTLTKECRQDPRHKDIPIIIITAMSGKTELVKAFESGATDFLTKPFHSTELLHRIKAHLQLRTLQVVMEATMNELNLQMLEVDRKQRALEEKDQELSKANKLLSDANRALLDHASKDSLTGLLNRRKGWDYMMYEEERSRRTKRPIGVALLDIDKFKSVNDNMGHDVGDQVLKTVSERLASTLRAADILVRWGGEEFLVIFPDTDEHGLGFVSEKIRHAVAAHPWALPDGRTITVSVGAVEKQPWDTWDKMVEIADRALYQAKERGRNRVVIARRPKAPPAP